MFIIYTFWNHKHIPKIVIIITFNFNLNYYFKSTKIKEFGYPLETHEVWTEDRAHLGLERIPHNGSTVIGKPVLLMHGLFSDSYIFTANNSSLSK